MSDLIKTRKGIYIPDITVEMFRNASLEAVKDLIVSGQMQDIILPSAEPEIIRCKDCRWKYGSECVRFADVRPFPDDFCSRAERRGEQE